MENDETLDVGETAHLLRAESETVMQFARCGELPGTRIGKSWVFLKTDVLSFLKQRILSDTEERRRHAAAPLAVAMERPKHARRTKLPVLPDMPKNGG